MQLALARALSSHTVVSMLTALYNKIHYKRITRWRCLNFYSQIFMDTGVDLHEKMLFICNLPKIDISTI